MTTSTRAAARGKGCPLTVPRAPGTTAVLGRDCHPCSAEEETAQRGEVCPRVSRRAARQEVWEPSSLTTGHHRLMPPDPALISHASTGNARHITAKSSFWSVSVNEAIMSTPAGWGPVPASASAALDGTFVFHVMWDTVHLSPPRSLKQASDTHILALHCDRGLATASPRCYCYNNNHYCCP